PQRFVFPQGVVIPAYGFLKILCDGNKPVSSANTGFDLKGSGGAVYLFAPGGILIDSINYGIQTPDFSIGRVPDGSTNWVLTLPTAGGANIAVGLGNYWQLRINEWMPNDSGGKPDWFEIYNPQSQPVSLSGLKVTDNLTQPDKNVFPPLSFIGALTNGYLKLIADNNLAAGADHVAFKLDNTTESIGLFASDNTMIDSITYYNPVNGVSEGRFPDGSTNIVRFYRTASPGAANYLWLTNVVINEALTHTDLPLEDAIELYNPTDQAVDISGWYLSDSDNNLKKYRIPPGTVIPPHGYKVFYEYQFNSDPGVNPLAFALSAYGDQVYLSTADSLGELTGYRTMVKFGAAPNGVSFGRYVNSVGEEDFVAMSYRTFGVDDPGTVEEFRQGQGAPNSYPLVGPVVISEIMYHPPDIGTNDNVRDEFIELYNNSGAPVPLYDTANPTNTWRLRDAVDFDFPTGIVMPPFGYVVVVSFDPQTNLQALAEFKAQYRVSESAIIIGPYNGKLANDNENVELYKPLSPALVTNSQGVVEQIVPYALVERVHYYDSGAWPVEADGNGYSLHRVSYTGYANDPTNWVAAPPTPGPQGLQIISQPQNASVVCGQDVSFSIVVSGQEPISYQWFFNGGAISEGTNATLVLRNVCTNEAGNYYVIAWNTGGAVTSSIASLTVSVPQAPLAMPDNVIGLKNQQLNIPVQLLLANDEDFNGATLTIIGVSGNSTNGATVTLNSGTVVYTPVANFVGIDEFTYTVRNNYGLQAVGTVYVTVAVSTNYNRAIAHNSGSNIQIEFEGLPGYTYEVLRSTNLLNWVVVQELQANQSGQILFTDGNTNSDHAYYRIRRK
ncbi:MAG: lamin tail domain-containing protein, partial [Limisphaerales bacterium]